jgi:hypothetical protein
MLSAALANPSASTLPVNRPDGLFLEALRSAGPLAGRSGTSDLFSGLIGDWDAEVVDHLPGDTDRRQSAEMHFAWVLEGRAVQDLWIAPARHQRLKPDAQPADGNRYGTTLRIYDPTIDAWRVTWWNPVTGAETRLIGRRVGSQIVQTGADPQGRLIRWVFVELRSDRFHWRGERSSDGGRTWTCETEYFARRRGTPPEGAAEPRAESRVSWDWTDRSGFETLRLVRNPAGTTAEGNVVVVLEGMPVSVEYRVEHDASWRFREARIETGRPGYARTVHIHRNQSGRWTIDGALRSDLEGCEDLDLAATPYTNTPALASRPLAPGESRRLRVAWVQVPALEIRSVEQEYTRLDSGGSSGTARYRYRNLESGFTAELSVDAHGLVINYGPWVRR